MKGERSRRLEALYTAKFAFHPNTFTSGPSFHRSAASCETLAAEVTAPQGAQKVTLLQGKKKEITQMVATIKNIAGQFVREEEGATLVEYVLLVALIGVVAITAMRFLGGTASNKLNGVSANIVNSN